ncbi:calcium-binding protein [Salipiger aestuarii]|uniref:calcium-binding protein n=1 Tax=Salipiger aestuarii TaxID=568098 RepID=UPI001238E005|nr:calcium-binding protein [Salipiger aestuarii]
MPNYTLDEDERFAMQTVTTGMFGANYVTIYDYEISQAPELIAQLASLNVSTLRFPGGSVTENAFTKASFQTGNYGAQFHTRADGSTQNLTTLGEYFAVAGQVGADAQLVIPTRVAFAQSAAQALAQGTYGTRSAIDSAYFDHLADFIDTARAEARANGVEITSVEIGNEFWGSGEMTAAEYGYLAGEVTNFMAATYPTIDVTVQITASTGIFSPLTDRLAYLEPDGAGDFILHWADDHNGRLPSGWRTATVPAQGNAITQTTAIADALVEAGAVNSIAGVVQHIYFDDGFAGIDTENEFALNVIKSIFENVTGLGDVEMTVSEWSPRNARGEDSNSGNANGLHYAHTVVEAFFELSAAGVDHANFWPITFSSAKTYRTLIDSDEAKLTFGGIAFQWLAQSAAGLRSVLDFSVEGRIDVHGFGNADTLALFAGERSGRDVANVSLDLSEMFDATDWFALVSTLGSESGTHADSDADPLVTHFDGYVGSGENITLGLDAWNMARVELQAITAGGDAIQGAAGNDTMRGDAGDDTLRGSDGDDQIKGQAGADLLYGGQGNDWLSGGWGDDTIYGGNGTDSLYGGGGADVMRGGAGGDVLYADAGRDFVQGEDGNDHIWLDGEAVFARGDAAENVSSRAQVGTGQMIGLGGKTLIEAVSRGGDGYDVLHLTDEADAFFLHDAITGFNDNVALSRDSAGRASAERFIGIEQIETGGGADLVDFTSPDYSMAGKSVRVDLGAGNDVFWGTDSDDVVIGGAGNDTIFGGTGTDRLTGGRGADAFEFTETSRRVTVTDFNPDEGDTLCFYNAGSLVFDESSISLTARGVSIMMTDSDTGAREVMHVTLEGAGDFSLSQITGAMEFF